MKSTQKIYFIFKNGAAIYGRRCGQPPSNWRHLLLAPLKLPCRRRCQRQFQGTGRDVLSSHLKNLSTNELTLTKEKPHRTVKAESPRQLRQEECDADAVV
jgi:hypothetical protein